VSFVCAATPTCPGLSGFDSVASADFVGLRGNSSPRSSGATIGEDVQRKLQLSYRGEAVRSPSGRSQLNRG
jgi:hypothetical protein